MPALPRIVALLSLAVFATPAIAQPHDPARVGVIDGTVSDTALRPLENADITIIGTSVRVSTGSNGRFRVRSVPAGHYLVIVRRLGYRPTSGVVEVGDDTLRLSYTLSASVQLLEGVRVEEKSVSVRELEFLSRRHGDGTFVTRDDIERRNPVGITDLLRPILSIDVVSVGLGGHVAVNRRGSMSLTVARCPFRIFLDDIPLPTPVDLDLLPPPSTLIGIEIYSGSATVPPRYNIYGAGCGIILLWSK
jgi:carboxypeptidase family protein